MFSKFSFSFFKPKPNLRVNALNLKAIEWLLNLVDKFNRDLKEVKKTLVACSLMEVDIDRNVEFKISSKFVEKTKEDVKVENKSSSTANKDKDMKKKGDHDAVKEKHNSEISNDVEVKKTSGF